MSDYKSYAQFNSLTITGRVSHAKVCEYKGSEFLAVTLISDLVTDGNGVAVEFTNSNGMLAMFKEDESNLKGRMLTVTGHLAEFSETYFNTKTGKREMLKRPRLILKQAQVFSGGYGAKKRSESEEIGEVMEYKAPVDNAEELAF